MSESPTAIIGGGITGLTAAYKQHLAGRPAVLFERADKIGGKIAETTVAGLAIPTGPDAFLARRPEFTALVEQLGLGDSLISPTATSPRIYRSGRLHRLPPNVLGVPATAEFGDGGLISSEGQTRAQQDLVAPADLPEGDETVGSLVRRRLGDEVFEYLVDPLLGGINAGDSDRLSIQAGVPQLDELRKRDASLIAAAQATLADARANRRGPVFHSVSGGLNRVIDRLSTELHSSPTVEVRTSTDVRLQHSDGLWSVTAANSNSDSELMLESDKVIVTTPAWAGAELLSETNSTTAELLASIDYSSVALATLVFAPETFDVDSAVSGVLVPRAAGHTVTAISFASNKWPDLAGDDRQILRVSVGRRNDESWMSQSEAELLTTILDDLGEILGSDAGSPDAKITTWRRSLPQYDLGHREKVAAIMQAAAKTPGLNLTGAWRDGLGLPACVAAGQAT